METNFSKSKQDSEQENNSTFAKPNSIAFRAKFSQTRRKDRKKKNIESGLLPNERP